MTKFEQLKAALDAATPGRWEADHENPYDCGDNGSDALVMCNDNFIATAIGNPDPMRETGNENATFIALAHNLMPQLLDAVALMQEACEHDTPISFVRKVEALLEKLK